ncbi:MAG: DUF5615 family PIN-like protein [Candidatus Symbiobacter sp.]|nr:DUF5615 family PIN-like protein [Candidatus Symbiobacter sp.]
MRILLDMNVSWRFVAVLNQAGFEATHWRDIGDPAAPDHEVFGYARENRMILITHDMDFGYIQRINQNLQPKLSVLLLRNTGGGISPDLHAIKLIAKLQELSSGLILGESYSIDLAKSKTRLKLVQI